MYQDEKVNAYSHFNDWPNTQGFDTHYEEHSPIELSVQGKIPSYAAGVLFRTGLGPRVVDINANTSFKVNHWFDNFGQVHRFQIHPSQSECASKVTYNSRLVSDGIIERLKRTGRDKEFTFAAKYDPCQTFFQKLQSVFRASESNIKPNEVNVCVTLSANFPGLSETGQKIGGPQKTSNPTTLCTRTDLSVFQMLNDETLEPIGLAKQQTLHPDLTGPCSAAHAKSDPISGDVFNYNLEFGRTGCYRVFKVSAATGKTSILAKIQHPAAYLHSLFITENYVILSVWNSFFTAGGASILWNKNLMDSMAWNDRQPTAWFLIDKQPCEEGGRGLIATYESEPFYCFHTINAYEEKSASNDGSVDIVADLIAYENMDCLKRFYMDNLLSDSPSAGDWSVASHPTVRPNYRRFRLPSVPNTAKKAPLAVLSEFTSAKDEAPELPTLSPRVVTKKHRFIYGMADTGKSTFMDSLIKFDVETHTVATWSVHGHTASEPIFVADPASAEEDGGVLLSVVLDGVAGKSYLLVLDARNMQEVGRAHVDGAIGFGFHGLHVKAEPDSSLVNGLSF